MFAYLGFRWELLEREQRQLEGKTAAAVKAAKKRNVSADEIYEIEHDGAGDYFHFQDEIGKLHSRYLSTQAARMLLPRPDLNDAVMWEKEGPNYIYLTEHGINHMKGGYTGRTESASGAVPDVGAGRGRHSRNIDRPCGDTDR